MKVERLLVLAIRMFLAVGVVRLLAPEVAPLHGFAVALLLAVIPAVE